MTVRARLLLRVLAIALAAVPATAAAAPFDPDPTFSGDGRVMRDSGGRTP